MSFDLDLEDLAGSGLVESVDENDDALHDVALRISGQYGELIASWATNTLASADPADTRGVEETVVNLRRLCIAANNVEQTKLLDEVLEILGRLSGTKPTQRDGESARIDLRQWLPRFGDTLGGADAERLRGIVEWSGTATPLMQELRSIPGVGPRRLTRLYAAGLADLQTVAKADPTEVAAVTAIPVNLCHRIVRRAAEYAEEERVRCIADIQQRAQRLSRLLDDVGNNRNTLSRAARAALDDVERAFHNLLAQGELP